MYRNEKCDTARAISVFSVFVGLFLSRRVVVPYVRPFCFASVNSGQQSVFDVVVLVLGGRAFDSPFHSQRYWKRVLSYIVWTVRSGGGVYASCTAVQSLPGSQQATVYSRKLSCLLSGGTGNVVA